MSRVGRLALKDIPSIAVSGGFAEVVGYSQAMPVLSVCSAAVTNAGRVNTDLTSLLGWHGKTLKSSFIRPCSATAISRGRVLRTL